MSESAPATPISKAAKVWKRTAVGGSIATVLALVLWAASAFDSVTPVFALCVLLLLVSLYELATMGALAGRQLLALLLGPALLCCYVTWLWLAGDGLLEPPVPVRYLAWGALALCTVAAFVPLVSIYALGRSRSTVLRATALLWPITLLLPGELGLYVPAVLVTFTALRLMVFGNAGRRAARATILLGTVLIVSIPCLAVAWHAFDHVGLVALIVICKVGDSAGFYVGSAIGKRHPFPAISPGKTFEGCLGSLVAGALCGAGAVALGWLPREPYGLVGGLVGGALVNLAAQASDLVESWVKRKAGVKDSGAWFGPSGGLLDLVDSFFLATPVALALWPLVFRFPDL